MNARSRHARVRGATRAALSLYAFVAPKPALSGQPGERIAECTDVSVQRRGTKTQIVLTLETDDGQVGRMWVDVPNPLTSTCRYMRLVTLARGTPPAAGEPIHPASDGLFRGKRFRVFVGWRKSESGKRRFDDTLAAVGPKDPKDFLRVHDLLERLDP